MWSVPENQPDIPEIRASFGDFLGNILIARGFGSNAEIREFYGCEELSDPFLTADMKKAADVISQAMENGEKITVFGDYDCDGVTAAVMLSSYLEMNGADVDFYIPERAEGFGMKIPALEKIVKSGTGLVITVDNGITACAEADFLRENGVKLVITDHHAPNGELPACEACVDPNRSDDISPFKELCGAGVVLKLLIALEGDAEFILESFSDLACIGTIGDVMPLYGENRLIVKRGLEAIRREQNPGISALARAAKVKPAQATANDLAMKICPRINCAGRVSSPRKAAGLLLAETPEQAQTAAQELSALNSERMSLQEKIIEDICVIAAEQPALMNERVAVLSGEGWHRGVTGVICSRVVEKYGRPAVMIAVENGVGVGSCRSIDGFSVHKMLAACEDLFAVQNGRPVYGGHPKSGGFTIKAENIPEFRRRVSEYSGKYHPIMPVSVLRMEKNAVFSELTPENIRLLEQLGPFGEGNRRPLFLFRNCKVKSKNPIADGKYVSLILTQNGVSMRAVSWEESCAEFCAGAGDVIDVCAEAVINEYNGNITAELHVLDYRPAGFDQNRFFAARRAYESLKRGEGCDARLLPRVVPQSREDLIKIYDLAGKYGERMSAEKMAVFGGDVNYCMLRITLDAFVEARMLERRGENFIINKNARKTDLFSTGLLSRIKVKDNKLMITDG